MSTTQERSPKWWSPRSLAKRTVPMARETVFTSPYSSLSPLDSEIAVCVVEVQSHAWEPKVTEHPVLLRLVTWHTAHSESHQALARPDQRCFWNTHAASLARRR